MAHSDKRGGSSKFDLPRQEEAYSKDLIGEQLDAFTQKQDIPSLRDRLRIGFNEVAMLAFDRTNEKIKGLVEARAESPEEAEKLYNEMVEMFVNIQTRGPWRYANELSSGTSDKAKLWFTIAYSEMKGYEKEMDLNDQEFVEDVKRIEKNLDDAAKNSEAFFQEAREFMLKDAKGKMRFALVEVGSGKKTRKIEDKSAPIGDGFAAFLPMALKGYDAGIVHDAEGWVFIGAREEIDEAMIEATGLKKEVGPDDRDPTRQVTFFVNDQGVKVIKKLHPAFLIVLTKSFDIARDITRAVNEKDVVRAAEDALGHTRVIQTTEKNREELEEVDEALERLKAMGYMRIPEVKPLTDELATSSELSRPREEFYDRMLYVRGMYVFMDALSQLHQRRKAEGKIVSEHDVDALSRRIWSKMEQKVEELRHVNGILDEEMDRMPANLTKVIDMAGGAGDLGLAITNEMLSRGREVEETEIVDPQEGVAEFMETIIEHLPFRKDLERIAHHNTGYLQDAEITPESIVVAKHACGTLTDAVIEQWRDSESPMLVAMTCCQDKAKDEPARYGFRQEEWSRLCVESGKTGIEVPDEPGPARDEALERVKEGMVAMKTLDMARVGYLRRHGFAARLDITDKFPKGDTIIARRLPDDFMDKLSGLERLEKEDPRQFENVMMKIDVLAVGIDRQDLGREEFGEDWKPEDFAELTSRFVQPAFEDYRFEWEVSAEKVAEAERLRKAEENERAKERQKTLMRLVFKSEKGRIDLYVKDRAQAAGKTVQGPEMGRIIEAIKNRMFRSETDDADAIRASVDELMSEMEY